MLVPRFSAFCAFVYSLPCLTLSGAQQIVLEDQMQRSRNLSVPRIFLTSASGYIGGEVLHQIKNSNLKSVELVALNRDATKMKQIQQEYPDVIIIEGDLDDTDLILNEAEKADIVLNLASTKHFPSAKAIVSGLTAASRPSKKLPAWVQMSGAILYCPKEIADSTFGEAANSSFADIDDISGILSLIQNTSTRVVEQLAISQDPSKLRTALLPGPLIYGLGKGPVHTRSIQAPELVRSTLELGHGIRLLKGKNAWSNIHVADLGSLILKLVEATLDDKDIGWNEEGIYNPENGAMTFGELDQIVADEAFKQGYIKDNALHEIDAKSANELSPGMSVFWGTNAVLEGQRAKSKLGWKPKKHSLGDEIPFLMKREAEAMGL